MAKFMESNNRKMFTFFSNALEVKTLMNENKSNWNIMRKS